jgi:hypothetical protein
MVISVEFHDGTKQRRKKQEGRYQEGNIISAMAA